MSAFAQPISVALNRRNPVLVPRRDVLVVGSDTPTLAATFYDSDAATMPADVTAASFLISLFREPDQSREWGSDYGVWHETATTVVAQFPGVPVDPSHGRVDFALAANPATYVVGRFWFEMTMSYPLDIDTGIGVTTSSLLPANYSQGNFTVLSGVMVLRPSTQIPLVQTPDLLAGIGVADNGPAPQFDLSQGYGILGSMVLGLPLAQTSAQAPPDLSQAYGILGQIVLG